MDLKNGTQIVTTKKESSCKKCVCHDCESVCVKAPEIYVHASSVGIVFEPNYAAAAGNILKYPVVESRT